MQTTRHAKCMSEEVENMIDDLIIKHRQAKDCNYFTGE